MKIYLFTLRMTLDEENDVKISLHTSLKNLAMFRSRYSMLSSSHFNVIFTQHIWCVMCFVLLSEMIFFFVDFNGNSLFSVGKVIIIKIHHKLCFIFHIKFWAFSSNVPSLLCLTQTFAFFFLLSFVFYSLFSYSQQSWKDNDFQKFYVFFCSKVSNLLSSSRHIQQQRKSAEKFQFQERREQKREEGRVNQPIADNNKKKFSIVSSFSFVSMRTQLMMMEYKKFEMLVNSALDTLDWISRIKAHTKKKSRVQESWLVSMPFELCETTMSFCQKILLLTIKLFFCLCGIDFFNFIHFLCV